MKTNKLHRLFLLIGIVSLFNACDDSENFETPEISTNKITDITSGHAIAGGTIIKNGGITILERGVCFSITPNPSIEDNKVIVEDDSKDSYSVEINISNNQQYYVRAYATNSKGTSYGQEETVIIYSGIPGEPVTDIDGNTYQTVKIGHQTWLRNNLKVTHYSNGDAIPLLTMQEDEKWLSTKKGAYCYYNDDLTNAETYGNLYNGFTVMDERNVCPSGWHIPSKKEWEELVNFNGGSIVAGNSLKQSFLWKRSHQNTSNDADFRAVPAGMRWHRQPYDTETFYSNLSTEVFFASRDVYLIDGVEYMWYMSMMDVAEWARISDNSIKTCGQSVRCIKN